MRERPRSELFLRGHFSCRVKGKLGGEGREKTPGARGRTPENAAGAERGGRM